MQGLSLGEKTEGQKEEGVRPTSPSTEEKPASPVTGESTSQPAGPTASPSPIPPADKPVEATDVPERPNSSASPATVLARDMVHGSPSSPQVLKTPSIAGASAGAGMKSPPPRPGPGVGGLGGAGRGLGAGRTGLQGGMSQGGGSKLPPTLQAKIDVSHKQHV